MLLTGIVDDEKAGGYKSAFPFIDGSISSGRYAARARHLGGSMIANTALLARIAREDTAAV